MMNFINGIHQKVEKEAILKLVGELEDCIQGFKPPKVHISDHILDFY